ncbi:hypothetical protein B566_EDAN010191 [Ephemera danica]|nr:hypothetical protein B566_EDAN010191 [Ephemera danica]
MARLCGGDAVPDIVSSGPRMLVEFSTSPFDSPFHPAPLSYLPGFELDIQVRMVASTPPRFYTQQGRCVFTVSSFESRQGQLGPPQHSLPANTTCRYEFAGRPTERVWVAFMKYHVAERTGAKPGTGLGGAGRSPAIRTDDFGGGDDERGEGSEQPEEDDDCAARLRIWDGRPPIQSHLQDNSSRLLGEFCRDESPRLCDHSLLSNSTRFPRPCAPGESYLSSGPTFTLEQHLRYGTALHPVSFVLRYEFVDVSQGGAPAPRTTPPYNMPTPTPPTWDCDRVFRHSLNNLMSSEPESGTFRSPRAVFFYGRGGNANLTCLYHFQASRERLQSVRLTVKRARFGERKCVTRVDLDTGRKVCELRSKNGEVADLRFFELPWEGVVVARDCICDEVTSSRSVSIAGAPGASLLVNFTIIAMNVTQDFTDFYFEGEYTFLVPDKNVHTLANTINGPCPRNSVLNPEGQKLRGSSGDLTLRSPNLDVHISAPTSLALSGSYEDECQNYPWLIELEDPYNFLYMEVRGTEIVGGRGGDECRTRNRVVVHSAQSLNPPTVICPDETGASTVAIFSPGWKNALAGASQAPPREHDRSLVIEFLEREPGGPYALSWLEISRRPVVTNPTTGATKVRGEALSAGLLSRPEPLPDCPYKCPELNACIAPELWCDGTSHCPSGYDELESNCEVQSTSAILDLFGGSLFVVYLAAGTAALVGAVLLVLAAALTAAKLRKRSAAAAAPGWRRGHNGVVSAPGLGPPIEAHKNGAARSRVDDLYGKDSLC